MINLSSWPHDRPEQELMLMRDALAECQTQDQAAHLLGAFLLCDVLADILMTPPVWREHWWQFWRMRQPGMLGK